MKFLMTMLLMPLMALAGEVAVTSVTAQQRYPWNGLVDIVVEIQGAAEDTLVTECTFTATNSVTKAAIPVLHVTRNGADAGSGNVWTRKFIWDATADVGAVKIGDVTLAVNAKPMGVQLWADGPYWAECNVGATKPEEYGYYFWWGDTIGYKRNSANNGWVSVKDGSSFSFSSGNCSTDNKDNSQLQSMGYIDSTGNLVAKYDAATAHLGASWRMPTDAEFSALIGNCTTTWTTRNGVYGRLVTGKDVYSSKSIFLPAAGIGGDFSLYELGSYGLYWSSSPALDNFDSARFLQLSSGNFCSDDFFRYCGRSVRPLRAFANAGGNLNVSDSAMTMHLSLDTRIGSRESPEEGVDIRYDASWYVGGVSVTVEDNGTVVISGLSGDFAWLPNDDGMHTLKLSIFDGSGSIVGLETAELFVVMGRRSITYVNLHGATHMNPETYQEGTAVNFTPPSGRTGYAFTGWTPAAITADMTGAQTVTAGWRANTYQIVYDANGGSGTMSATDCEYDKEGEVAANGFTRTGYVFKGWAMESNGEVVYEPGAKLMNLTAIAGGTVKFYAVWAWTAPTESISLSGIEARQRYPWNGLVDIIVTMQGAAEDVVEAECVFVATNSATKAAIPVAHITQNGDDVASSGVVTRKFIWDAKVDVGAVKIDDVALTVDVELPYVQLWKDGPCWAKCNVGATKPEECGYYFWWGDTVGYKYYASGNQWTSGWISVKDSTSHLFSGCPTYGKDNSRLQSAGYIDATGNLVATHDAATAHLGASWRMPTGAEFVALIKSCDTEWTTRNGVAGCLVTGKGDYASKSIFLPAAGYGYSDTYGDRGMEGYYWSSTPCSNFDEAGFQHFDSKGSSPLAFFRYFGMSVRPVRRSAK